MTRKARLRRIVVVVSVKVRILDIIVHHIIYYNVAMAKFISYKFLVWKSSVSFDMFTSCGLCLICY